VTAQVVTDGLAEVMTKFHIEAASQGPPDSQPE
jgi:hypothetical protein